MSIICAPESVRSVLVVSADQPLRDSLAAGLAAMRWHVRTAGGGAEALYLIEDGQPAAVLLDGWLPDLEVREFSRQIEAQHPGIELLGMDGGTLGSGPAGLYRNELLHLLRDLAKPTLGLASPSPGAARHTASISSRNPALPKRKAVTIEGMIGDGVAMSELRRLIALVAPHRSTVLIQGETGTGKELVAQAIHRLSPRAARPIAVLNCAAIPEALLEAELFGHTRGAFTGAVASRTGRIEAAQGGTLFLDEIGEMPLPLQAKMLRFIECGELQRIGDNETLRVDVRIVAATHQDLEQRAAAGTFRLDLFHRLSVFPLEVPPLRCRIADIPALCDYLLDGLAARQRPAPAYHLTTLAMELLVAHSWPGNVRELGHVLERATILADGETLLGAEHMRLHSANAVRPAACL